MADQKIENLLNMSLQVSEQEREKSPSLQTGYDKENQTWEIIVKFIGDIELLKQNYPEITITQLMNQYAIIRTPQQYVEAIARETYIEFVEKPKRMYFGLRYGMSVSCITPVLQDTTNPYGMTGEGTIVAIIDTGIDAIHSEFRNSDGTTRIINIWDQSTGMQMNQEEIDAAISQNVSGSVNTKLIGRDIVGHGTAVAIIACGNSGVARKADIIAVKMGLAEENSFPRTTQLMEAVNYVILKAAEYGKPVSINVSFGNNYGNHTGTSLLETFLNDVSGNWKTNICVGAGNEGLGATHSGGRLVDDSEKEIEIAVSDYETSLSIQIWKDYWDQFEVEIITPSGVNLGRISKYQNVNRIQTAQTTLLTYYGQPSPYSVRQEIYIDMIPVHDYIQSGVWKLRLVPVKIKTGYYDIWLPDVGTLNTNTGFLLPNSDLTYTIPSTAQQVITVGAYDDRTDQYASFSGRGYVARVGATTISKPDLVAPGVNIYVPGSSRGMSDQSRASTQTGTSFATPFVTGSVALMMDWGIVKGNDPFLYGEKVKAYLISGARHLPGYDQWPNPVLGWGALCLKDSIPG